MRNNQKIAVIIPALNEEQSVGQVLSATPQWVDDVIVVDNGSTDRTTEIARAHEARVVSEPRRGYGAACLAGIAALENPDVVVFLDGDFSDHPEEMAQLVDPITSGEVDLVIGSRLLGQREPGSLTPQARFGNWLACILIRLFWNVRYTDLGPFRAIRALTLNRLRMNDHDYGWTVEMQIKAARQRVRVREVPVNYRRRIGKSKVSGTFRGIVGAGGKILFTIFRAALDSRRVAREGTPREPIIISIIIPTLNEAATIPQTLPSTRTGSDVEVIVVDGGSRDQTVELAESLGAKVLTSPPGRARQMNVGARAAAGDVLLFLHADTRLPTGFEEHVRHLLTQPGIAAGAFELKLDSPLRRFRIIERLVNWRSRYLRMPYGDQAIFVRADLFREIGGYPDIPLMEDVHTVRRLSQRGRIAIAPAPVVTSVRRWERLGVLKTTLINQAVIAADWLGVAPSRLARWYYRNQGRA